MEPNFINQFLPFIPKYFFWLAPLFKFTSLSVAFYFLAKIISTSYRTHAHLYSFENVNQTYDNWIDSLYPFAKSLPLDSYRKKISPLLGKAGWRPDWDANHYIAMQVFKFSFVFFTMFLFFTMLLDVTILIPLIFATVIAILPSFQIKTLADKRVKRINKQLGGFIEYMALSISAGLDFNGALEVVTPKVEKGPLQEEFFYVLRNIKLGKSRADALREFKDRVESTPVSQFVETLVQSMEQGSSVADTLQTIASNLNTKRFQEAEEEAGKISVKMIIPVVIFILPAIMLMLMGPMIIEYVLMQ